MKSLDNMHKPRYLICASVLLMVCGTLNADGFIHGQNTYVDAERSMVQNMGIRVSKLQEAVGYGNWEIATDIRRRLMKPTIRSGSAGWATSKEIRKAGLANALALLCDQEQLMAALSEAQFSKILQGDFARLAKDLLTKFNSGDSKQIESFREGAVQSIDVFSASGNLAECTSTCDFRFTDLKKKKMTIYVLADPTRMSVYAPWLGLLSWCALTELIRFQNSRSVCFLLDEICNFKIEGLPSLLTLAREFKIKMWLIVQELEQFGEVYGKQSIETLLSQTEVKIIMGSRSHKTCQLVSNMLGDETIKAVNHNLGASILDDVSESLTEMPRRLMTPDEVRRTPFTIIFVRDLRPILVNKIGYHEVHPWKKKIGINPLFGKRLKGRTRLRF